MYKNGGFLDCSMTFVCVPPTDGNTVMRLDLFLFGINTIFNVDSMSNVTYASETFCMFDVHKRK